MLKYFHGIHILTGALWSNFLSPGHFNAINSGGSAYRAFLPKVFLVALFFFVGAPFAHAAITLDTNTSAEQTTTPVSYTTSGTNRLLIVAVSGDSTFTDSVTGVTYGGVAMTLINKGKLNNDRYIYLFYLLNPAIGANSIAIGGTFYAWNAASYDGVKQTAPEVTNTNFITSGSPNTNTVTTLTSGDWLIENGEYVSGCPVAGTNTTKRDSSCSPTIFDSNGPITPAGSASLQFTDAGTNGSGAIMAAFAPYVAPTTHIYDIITSWVTWLF